MLLLAGASCESDATPTVTVTTPTAPAPPACQADHTAQVSFQNLGESYVDVLLDGLYLGTLPPESPPGFQQAVAANVAHRLEWRVTNSMTMPCPEARPIAVECSTVIWTSCYGF